MLGRTEERGVSVSAGLRHRRLPLSHSMAPGSRAFGLGLNAATGRCGDFLASRSTRALPALILFLASSVPAGSVSGERWLVEDPTLIHTPPTGSVAPVAQTESRRTTRHHALRSTPASGTRGRSSLYVCLGGTGTTQVAVWFHRMNPC